MMIILPLVDTHNSQVENGVDSSVYLGIPSYIYEDSWMRYPLIKVHSGME